MISRRELLGIGAASLISMDEPNAPTDLRWQWVFPQEHRWVNSKTRE
jgi:hypothetical protein